MLGEFSTYSLIFFFKNKKTNQLANSVIQHKQAYHSSRKHFDILEVQIFHLTTATCKLPWWPFEALSGWRKDNISTCVAH